MAFCGVLAFEPEKYFGLDGRESENESEIESEIFCAYTLLPKSISLSMFEYLTQIPCEVLGEKMFGFLELIDIIQLENAAASQKSQQLLRAILPYCPPIITSKQFEFKRESIKWLIMRRTRVEHVKIAVKALSEIDFEHSALDNIEVCLNKYTTLKDLEPLESVSLRQRASFVNIEDDQDPAVMEVLFSLLTNSSVREFVISSRTPGFPLVNTITEYCPYLEKLSLNLMSDLSEHTNILQSIARNWPHLRCLVINKLNYTTSTEADADLTVFAEKCPQLEELSLNCREITDQSVIALAQHCSRLKMLRLKCKNSTPASLIALSERGLPLEELGVPRIPIPSAEIAAQCAHALSRICYLVSYRSNYSHVQYMTRLRQLCFYSSEDHLLAPNVLLQLQRQCCAGLEGFIVGSGSSITAQQLCELLKWCPQLHTFLVDNLTCNSNSNTVLLELARSCPHLQKVTLCSSEVTEEGVLALAAHCRQLRVIDIGRTPFTMETVRQLAQHCRRLTELHVRVNVREGEVMAPQSRKYTSKEIRVLRL